MKLEEIVNKRVGHVEIDPTNVPLNGVVFCYSSWSAVAVARLQLLIAELNKQQYSHLYIYDIDKPNYQKFIEKYGTMSHAKGEIYVIKNGELNQKVESLQELGSVT